MWNFYSSCSHATVWCPFDKKESEYVKVLSKYGFSVSLCKITVVHWTVLC